MKPFLLLFLIYLPRLILPLNPQNVNFHGDEAVISQEALRMFQQGISQNTWDFFGSGLGTVSRFPAPWYYLQGAIIYFLGPSLFSLKIFSWITDLGIAVLVYLITKPFWSKELFLYLSNLCHSAYFYSL